MRKRYDSNRGRNNRFWKKKRERRRKITAFTSLVLVVLFVFALALFGQMYGRPEGCASEEEIYEYLTSGLGYNPAAASGIMGNLKSESNFNSYNLQDKLEKQLGYSDVSYTEAVDNGSYSFEEFISDSAGYGLCQWTFESRKEGLYELAKERGVSISDYRMQLDYMDSELGDEKREYLMSFPDTEDGAYEAGCYFCEVFERPKNTEAPKERGASAKKYFKKYGE